jgi:ribose transport system ATP-binding protein
MTASGSVATPILRIRNLSKSFAGVRVLSRVDLDVMAGEVHALIGQNGSGKSTLIKVLAGFHAPDPGAHVQVDGAALDLDNSAASRSAGIRFVHQDLALVDSLNTIENLAVGRGFATGFAGRIRWSHEQREAERRMHALGYHFDVRRPVSELAAAERTGIAIARALYDTDQARLLVLDEPTASLPRGESTRLFEAVSRLRASGIGVIYVSHRLDEVFAIADRVTALRDGHRVDTVPTSEVDQDGLVRLMVGDVDLHAPEPAGHHAESGPAVLQVDDLGGEVVDRITFAARGGEVLGICGLTGSGRDELLPMIFGGLSRSGSVSVAGQEIPAGQPRSSIAAGMALVAADRHAEGSVAALSVRENCTLVDLKRFSRLAGALSAQDERGEVDEWIERLDVRPARSEAVFATLSGGNQQKIVLAKWLRMSPAVLMLDEPTQGVDVHAKATIHGLAREAATAGAAVVIASSDDAELCDTCDRILVLSDGQIVAELTGPDINRTEVGRRQHAITMGV